MAPERIALDPGIGFGKTQQHNLEILARLAEFQRLGRPVCLGVSRKGFIGKIIGRPMDGACWPARWRACVPCVSPSEPPRSSGP